MKTQSYSKLLLYVVLCFTLVVGLGLMSGCKGSNGAAGANGVNGTNGTNGVNGTNGTNGVNGTNGTNGANGIGALTSVLTYTTVINSVVVTSDTTSASMVINFSVQYINPDTGAVGGEIVGLDAPDSVTATNLGHLRFNMVKLIPGLATAGTSTDLASNEEWNSWWAVGSSERTAARLTNNGNGLYTYTTGTMAVSGATPTYNFYDPKAYTRVVLLVMPKDNSGSGNFVSPVAIELGEAAKYDFIGNSGTLVSETTSTLSQDVVPTAQCLNCHATFGDPRLNPLAFHPDEGRVETYACVVCHDESNFTMDITAVSSGVTYTFPFGEGALGTWIHKIHTAQVISTFTTFTSIEYPQDIRNCTTCHSNGADSANWMNRPSAKACLSCHNPNYTLDPVIAGMAALTSPSTTHGGGQIGPIGSGLTNDTECFTCHGPDGIEPVAKHHETDFSTTHNPVATEPTISFAISAISVSPTTSAPTITFTIYAGFPPAALTPVTLNTSAGFVVSGTTFTATNLPASDHPQTLQFLFAYAVPQDGIAQPSDWNNRAESYTVNLSSLASGTTAGTLTHNADGSYTAVVSASTFSVPSNATLLTGALCGLFEDETTGVNIPGLASMVTAKGYTPRRVIITTANCNKCHEQLGDQTLAPLTPTSTAGYNIHDGAYDTPTLMCAMCHTPDLTGSNGWSASFRVWYHALHADTIRTVAFEGNTEFPAIAYPGVLSNCEQCHLPGTYDFSASQYTPSLIANFLMITDVTGTPAASALNAPYFVANGVNNYGITAAVTNGTATDGAANLVSSPITATCTACHDASDAIDHMVENGGAFYVPRSTAFTNTLSTVNQGESCLVCHGPGAIESIQSAHNHLIIQNQ